jgi:hypothetical protein
MQNLDNEINSYSTNTFLVELLVLRHFLDPKSATLIDINMTYSSVHRLANLSFILFQQVKNQYN